MPTWGIIIIAILVVIVLIIGFIAGIYNSLVQLDERVNEAWSDITVQLKYRADLIPNVLETVKGYAKHEKETFQMVTELQDVEDKIQASRRFYNAGAKDLNTKIKTFPTNIVNNFIGHFKKRDYFEVSEAEKAKIDKAPEVKF